MSKYTCEVVAGTTLVYRMGERPPEILLRDNVRVDRIGYHSLIDYRRRPYGAWTRECRWNIDHGWGGGLSNYSIERE